MTRFSVIKDKVLLWEGIIYFSTLISWILLHCLYSPLNLSLVLEPNDEQSENFSLMPLKQPLVYSTENTLYALTLYTYETCSVGVDVFRHFEASVSLSCHGHSDTKEHVSPCRWWKQREAATLLIIHNVSSKSVKKHIRRQGWEISVSGLKSDLLMFSMATVWRWGELSCVLGREGWVVAYFCSVIKRSVVKCELKIVHTTKLA